MSRAKIGVLKRKDLASRSEGRIVANNTRSGRGAAALPPARRCDGMGSETSEYNHVSVCRGRQRVRSLPKRKELQEGKSFAAAELESRRESI
jgi:hypothetical protein